MPMEITMENTVFFYDNFLEEPFRLALESGTLIQVSELCLKPGGKINFHVQVCDEITVALSGRSTVYSGGEQSRLSAGQIHYVKKGISHEIKADENFRYICIGFEPNHNDENIAPFLKLTSDKSSFILKDNSDVKKLSEMLLDEFYSAEDNRRVMINMYLSQILILISRLASDKQKNQTVKRPDFTLYSIMRLIDMEYMNIKGVKDVAKRLSYSECYISHLFRQKLDMTVKEYILKKKLDAAALILRDKKMTVTEAAEYLGFSSAHTFAIAFKRCFGVSPLVYKQQKNDDL